MVYEDLSDNLLPSAAASYVVTQHYPMLRRNLLYTSVTRGRRLVVLVRQMRAVAIAVRHGSGRRRWSKLRELLVEREVKPSGEEPAEHAAG